MEGEIINKSTLQTLINQIKVKADNKSEFMKDADNRNRFLKIFSYYSVLKSEDEILYSPKEWVEKYDFIKTVNNGCLKVCLLENDYTRAVLQTRKTGMSINERKK